MALHSERGSIEFKFHWFSEAYRKVTANYEGSQATTIDGASV